MPKCINDSSRRYNGTEPSPTGLGYCSNGEDLNVTKRGKDGNLWIVSKNKNNVKKWELYQTYPYVSIIFWIKNDLINNKSLVDVKDLNTIVELKNILDLFDDNEISFEFGVSKLEIDFELFDNFEKLGNDFYDKIKCLKKFTNDIFNFEINSVEVLYINLNNDNEEMIEL